LNSHRWHSALDSKEVDPLDSANQTPGATRRRDHCNDRQRAKTDEIPRTESSERFAKHEVHKRTDDRSFNGADAAKHDDEYRRSSPVQ
jgi:hypothetical protein